MARDCPDGPLTEPSICFGYLSEGLREDVEDYVEVMNKEKEEIHLIEKYRHQNTFLHYIYTEWDKGKFGSILEYKMKMKPELDRAARELRYNNLQKKL